MRPLLILLALAGTALANAGCGDPDPETVLVEAAPLSSRNCGGPGEPSPPPPDGLSLAVTVDPPSVPRWPDAQCRGDRARILCERVLSPGDSIFTDFRFDEATVRIYYGQPDRCELEYRITRLAWGVGVEGES